MQGMYHCPNILPVFPGIHRMRGRSRGGQLRLYYRPRDENGQQKADFLTRDIVPLAGSANDIYLADWCIADRYCVTMFHLKLVLLAH